MIKIKIVDYNINIGLFILLFLTINSCNNSFSTNEIKTVDSIAYNEIEYFSDCFDGDSGKFLDFRDSNIYDWVRIGDNIWMAENIAFKTDSACVVYNHNEKHLAEFGYLYSWDSAQIACPYGWHLPSEEEFITLQNELGEFGQVAFDSYVAGNDLGMNFINTGTYDIEHDKFRRFIISRLVNMSYWSSTYSYTRGDSVIFYSILSIDNFKGYFSRGFETDQFYHPVRCIKDK